MDNKNNNTKTQKSILRKPKNYPAYKEPLEDLPSPSVFRYSSFSISKRVKVKSFEKEQPTLDELEKELKNNEPQTFEF